MNPPEKTKTMSDRVAENVAAGMSAEDAVSRAYVAARAASDAAVPFAVPLSASEERAHRAAVAAARGRRPLSAHQYRTETVRLMSEGATLEEATRMIYMGSPSAGRELAPVSPGPAGGVIMRGQRLELTPKQARSDTKIKKKVKVTRLANMKYVVEPAEPADDDLVALKKAFEDAGYDVVGGELPDPMRPPPRSPR
jgi:hypothetical protein